MKNKILTILLFLSPVIGASAHAAHVEGGIATTLYLSLMEKGVNAAYEPADVLIKNLVCLTHYIPGTYSTNESKCTYFMDGRKYTLSPNFSAEVVENLWRAFGGRYFTTDPSETLTASYPTLSFSVTSNYGNGTCTAFGVK
jgi:hypothetical protein